MPRFTPLVDALPNKLPFIAPERLERDGGQPLVLRLGANESVFGVAEGVREAMVQALEEVCWYGDPESLALRDAITRRHDVSPGNISVGAGIDDLLGLTVRTLLEPGQVGVGSYGAYPMFAFHVAGYGGRLETVPYCDDRTDLAGLIEAAHRHQARLVYLVNPDNPSGSVLSIGEIAAFARELPEDAVLMLDQAYAELAPPDAMEPLSVDSGRAICFRTFSKAFGMAGARIGYALASSAVVQAFDKVRAHFAVNRVAQAGALASLSDDAFLKRVRAENAAGLADYARIGEVIGAPTLPSSTNFALFDFGTAPRAEAALAGLTERGVFVRKPLVPPLDRCVRISIGTPKARQRLAEILREMHEGGVF